MSKGSTKASLPADRVAELAGKHLLQLFPVDCAVAGSEGVAAAIAIARERAQSYDLYAMDEILAYLELMVLLGSSFDEDPQIPWVKRLLRADAASEIRVAQLRGKAWMHLRQVAGEEGDLYRAALERVPSVRLSDLSRLNQKLKGS